MTDIFIYALCDPDTEEPRYVGQTGVPQLRYKEHLTSKSGIRKVAWINSLRECGKLPVMKIIETTDEGQAGAREYYWIEQYRLKGIDLLNSKKVVARNHARGFGKGGKRATYRLSNITIETLHRLAEIQDVSQAVIIENAIREYAKAIDRLAQKEIKLTRQQRREG